MGYNKAYKHTSNGLVQKSMLTFNTGFELTVSIATGVAGEATCLIINDRNLYPDDDSRSERPNQLVIPIDDTEDLIKLRDLIDKCIEERNKTLIKEYCLTKRKERSSHWGEST